jgi:hypothetical protein
MTFVPANSFLIERGCRQIPIHGFEIAEAMGFQTKGRHYSSLRLLAANAGFPVDPYYPARKA